MTQKGRLVMLAIALAMGITGWYGLTHKRQAKVGDPCAPSDDFRQASDGSMLRWTQDLGWKRVQ